MDTSVLRYRYRAYPTAKQRRSISRLLGGCRVAFNDALDYVRAEHDAGRKYPGLTAIQHQVLTVGKKRPDREWMNEVSGVALIQAVRDMQAGYGNFFASVQGKRKGRKVSPPRYRSRRDSVQSARFTRAARFRVTKTGERQAVVRLTGIGDLKFVLSRDLPSEPSSVTLIREADGRTYVSFVVRVENEQAATTNQACGIDAGLSNFATVISVDSNTGEATSSKIDTPLFLRRRARALARSQRAMSRKQAGSSNRRKAKVRVAVLHRKVREARLDHAHQHAAKIVASHDVICVEDLAVAGMAKTKLAKSVNDQGMGQFLRLLSEKAARQGKAFVRVDRYFPSTQICSHCKSVTGPKGRSQIHVREWTCAECGVSHDRDINAARNILEEGLRLLQAGSSLKLSCDADGQSESLNACGDSRSPSVMPVASVGEAGRIAGDRQKERVA